MTDADRKRMEEITLYWLKAQPTISSFISSLVPDFQDADDILQQVALAIIKNYDSYDDKYSFISWAIGIARNEILMYWRKKKKAPVLTSEAIQAVSYIYDKESAQLDEMKQALALCVTRLKGKWKQLVEMRYLNDLSISGISRKINMKENAIYTNLHRIRLSLRDCIRKQVSSEDNR